MSAICTPVAGGGTVGEEEMFIVDEFSWDVYEAAARLSERIKAAAGLALFRDGIVFADLALPDELVDEPDFVGMPGFQSAMDDRGDQLGSSITSPARSPGRDDPTSIKPTSNVTASLPADSGATPIGTPILTPRETLRTDTRALVPPRVKSRGNLSENSTDGSATLLVGPGEMNETWVLLDGFRVRVEMLPGGLLPERDSIFEELNFLLSGLQTWVPDGREGTMPSFLQISEMVRFSERVKQLEATYMAWAEDENAPPLDEASKQRVRDWLGIHGEKEIALETLRSCGARRCQGCQGPDQSTECRKLLRFELYRCGVQRCLQCKQQSKQAVAAVANASHDTQSPSGPSAAVARTGSSSSQADKRQLRIEDQYIGVIEVEARELAFALFVAEMNSYYPALVLPSDLAFSREHNQLVTVNWMDGDTEHRQVPPTEVFLLDEWQAAEVRGSTVAHWDNRLGMLMPGGDAQGEFSFGESTPMS
jgi:hypothetical protein